MNRKNLPLFYRFHLSLYLIGNFIFQFIVDVIEFIPLRQINKNHFQFNLNLDVPRLSFLIPWYVGNLSNNYRRSVVSIKIKTEMGQEKLAMGLGLEFLIIEIL